MILKRLQFLPYIPPYSLKLGGGEHHLKIPCKNHGGGKRGTRGGGGSGDYKTTTLSSQSASKGVISFFLKAPFGGFILGDQSTSVHSPLHKGRRKKQQQQASHAQSPKRGGFFCVCVAFTHNTYKKGGRRGGPLQGERRTPPAVKMNARSPPYIANLVADSHARTPVVVFFCGRIFFRKKNYKGVSLFPRCDTSKKCFKGNSKSKITLCISFAALRWFEVQYCGACGRSSSPRWLGLGYPLCDSTTATSFL